MPCPAFSPPTCSLFRQSWSSRGPRVEILHPSLEGLCRRSAVYSHRRVRVRLPERQITQVAAKRRKPPKSAHSYLKKAAFVSYHSCWMSSDLTILRPASAQRYNLPIFNLHHTLRPIMLHQYKRPANFHDTHPQLQTAPSPPDQIAPKSSPSPAPYAPVSAKPLHNHQS